MRLIDADSLYNKVENKYKSSSGETHKAYSEILDMLVEAPDVQFAVDPSFCPIKLGQKVYRVIYYPSGDSIVSTSTITSIIFSVDGRWEAKDDAGNVIVIGAIWQKDDTQEVDEKTHRDGEGAR